MNTRSHHRPLRRIIGRSLTAVAFAALAAGLTGCQGEGHGEHTQGLIDQSQKNLALLKAKTKYDMAHQEFLAGKLDKALKTTDKALEITEDVPKVHVLRGRILMEKGMLSDARLSFITAREVANEQKVDTAEPDYYLGILYERFTKPEMAYEHYLAASRIDPTNPQYVVAAAEMLTSMERLDEAEALLTSSEDQFEYDPGVRQTLGHIWMMRGNPSKAVRAFNEALLLAPDDVVILEDLIHAQIGARQFAEAEFNLSRLLAMPEHAERRDLEHLRARCLAATDRPLEAREILDRLTSDPEGSRDVAAWVDLGNVAYTLKDQTRLKKASSRVIAIAPARYEGYYLRAALHRLRDETDQALESVDKAIRIAGLSTNGPLILKGLILRDMGRMSDAKRIFARAVEMDPQNVETRRLHHSMPRGEGTLTGVETAPE